MVSVPRHGERDSVSAEIEVGEPVADGASAAVIYDQDCIVHVGMTSVTPPYRGPRVQSRVHVFF